MPTERIADPSQSTIKRDPQMDHMCADSLRLIGWNPDRIVIQSGTLVREGLDPQGRPSPQEFYVLHFRFPDLFVWSADGTSQKIHLTVEQAEMTWALKRNARLVGLSYMQGLIVWAQARIGEVTMLAHAEWERVGKKSEVPIGWHPWPADFPKPLKYDVKILNPAN